MQSSCIAELVGFQVFQQPSYSIPFPFFVSFSSAAAVSLVWRPSSFMVLIIQHWVTSVLPVSGSGLIFLLEKITPTTEFCIFSLQARHFCQAVLLWFHAVMLIELKS